jgi:hypothetical protein
MRKIQWYDAISTMSHTNERGDFVYNEEEGDDIPLGVTHVHGPSIHWGDKGQGTHKSPREIVTSLVLCYMGHGTLAGLVLGLIDVCLELCLHLFA